jgi:hypothetical protein
MSTAHMARTDQEPGIWHAFPSESAAESWAAAHAVATGQTVYICHTNQGDQ